MMYEVNKEGEQDREIYTECGFIIAKGFERIVEGERGAYMEFTKDQIRKDAIRMPHGEKWRINNEEAYYMEYRTLLDKVMVYFQKRTVKYADYKIGMYYISVHELYILDGNKVKSMIREMDNRKQLNLEQCLSRYVKESREG